MEMRRTEKDARDESAFAARKADGEAEATLD